MTEPQGLLSQSEVERLRDVRGRDLRVQEAAERRRKAESSSAGIERTDAVFPGGQRARLFQRNLLEDKHREEITLPPVGRHTEALEHPLSTQTLGHNPNPLTHHETPATPAGLDRDAKLSKRPGAVPVPDFKKPKLTNDQEMEVKIEPGESIQSQETDVEIPALPQADSPSFASQAREIPAHKVLTIDMTQCDNDDDDAADAPDELSAARCSPTPNLSPAGSGVPPPQLDATTQNQQLGAFPALIHNNLPEIAGIPPPPQGMYSAPQDMPPWLQDIHQGLQSLHTKADRQFAVFSSEIQNQHIRLNALESVSSEHTGRHTATESKIAVLERKIKQLEEGIEHRSRSPVRFGHASGGRSPRSPLRSPRQGGSGKMMLMKTLTWFLAVGLTQDVTTPLKKLVIF